MTVAFRALVRQAVALNSSGKSIFKAEVWGHLDCVSSSASPQGRARSRTGVMPRRLFCRAMASIVTSHGFSPRYQRVRRHVNQRSANRSSSHVTWRTPFRVCQATLAEVQALTKCLILAVDQRSSTRER